MKNSNNYENDNKVKTFTLVELLVVMAVILLLAGLFLPALNRARKQALTASCMNNLSQISKASALYLSDSEYYTPCFAADVEKMAEEGKTWLGYRTKSGSDTIYNLKTGFIADYLKENTQVLYCPAWKKGSNDTELNATNGTGYGYNTCIGTWVYLTGKSYGSGAGLKINQVANPSSTVGFGDTCNGSSTKTILQGIAFIYPKYVPQEPFEQIVFPKTYTNGDNIHFGRHAGTANILWLDGHASQEKASRLKLHDLARKELIGNFGPDDNSLFDPWNL